MSPRLLWKDVIGGSNVGAGQIKATRIPTSCSINNTFTPGELLVGDQLNWKRVNETLFDHHSLGTGVRYSAW